MNDDRTRVGRLTRWLLVGPVAVVGLLAVVAGGPLLLVRLGVNPLPSRMMSGEELLELLTTPDDGQLLLWALSVVGWGAWAVVAGSLLLELGAQLAGRRTPRVPGLGGPQRLAAVLVAGVVTALTAPGVSHAQAAFLDGDDRVTAAPAPQVGELFAPVPVPADRSGGSAYLPDARPVGLGTVPPPLGAPAPAPGVINPPVGQLGAPPAQWGTLPAGQWGAPPAAEPDPPPAAEPPEPLMHEVAPGDWMWHIAGRYLGDELRYPEIAELNPEYDQRYEDFPDHIQPGDRLLLPPDAYDRGERPHAGGELLGDPEPADEPAGEPPTDPPPTASTPTTGAAGAGDGGAEPPDGHPADEPPAQDDPPARDEPAAPDEPPAAGGPAPDEPPAPDGPPAVPLTPAPQAPGPYPPPPQAADPAAGDPAAGDPAEPASGPVAGSDDPVPGATPLLAAGVLASVLLGALVLYRWRKMARRRHRRTLTGPADAGAENQLRSAATADVARLDRALRALAVGLGDRLAEPDGADRLPDLGAVWVGEGEIHLILATSTRADPPEPFHPGGPGSWFLPVDAELPERDRGSAPLPALVTVASQPGQHLLVDLERMGTLTVAGPPERVSDLLRYLVAELAHNPWSERATVTLVGFPPESERALTGLNPDRVTVAGSLAEAVADLERRLSRTTAALANRGLADTLHGRAADTADGAWPPHLLLVDGAGPDDDEQLARLEAALAGAGRRCAVAAVVGLPGRERQGRRTLTITEDGLLKAAFLDDSHPMTAVGLPEHLLGPLVQLIRDAADGPDHPVPPASEAWAAGTDAAGGRTGEPAPAPAGSPATGDGTWPALPPGRSELTQETDFVADADTVDTPCEVDPPSAASVGRTGPGRGTGAGPVAAVAPTDGELDELVADWRRDDTQPPRLSLLGPVELAVPGPPPNRRLPVCQELIVYLAAVGDRGADVAEISRQLWPNQPVRSTDRTDVVMNVRRWLGSGPDGQPWLSEAVPDGRYRLRSGVLVDWHLFRRLRARGERRGRAGLADLRTALSLVRGAPLAGAGEVTGAGRVPYSWLAGSTVDPELMVTAVVDTAHQLVELCLAVDDPDTARWAVEQAWLADPRRGDDHPWRDLLRVADAERDHQRIEAVVAELLRWRGVAHPDELAPETRELVRRLLPKPVSAGGWR